MKPDNEAPIIEAGELPFGIKIDGVVHRAFELRAAKLADEYAATAVVPIPPEGVADVGFEVGTPVRTAYEYAVGDMIILHQLTKLGTLDPLPLPQTLAGVIEPEDMGRLRVANFALKKKRTSSSDATPAKEEAS